MSDTSTPVVASGTFKIGGDHAAAVRRLGFGTMQLAGPGVWGPPADRDAAVAVLRRAIDLGVDFIDTADSYGPHVVEELIHHALHPYPDHVRIATKAGFTRAGPDQWTPLGRRDYLRTACEGSLRRLAVDRIDLFQLHRIDPEVPVDEQFGVLRELRDEGKVATVGLSEVSIENIDAARQVVPIATVQNLYNLGTRASDEVVAYCEREAIGFIPWFPLASGKLASPGGPLDSIVRQTGATQAQVALAWLLRRSRVMLPIPGTSSLRHLDENCAAALVELTDEQFDELSDARRPLRRWIMT